MPTTSTAPSRRSLLRLAAAAASAGSAWKVFGDGEAVAGPALQPLNIGVLNDAGTAETILRGTIEARNLLVVDAIHDRGLVRGLVGIAREMETSEDVRITGVMGVAQADFTGSASEVVGVLGQANTTSTDAPLVVGVRGTVGESSSNTAPGIGVDGVSKHGSGVQGTADERGGIGVRAVSANGVALDVQGRAVFAAGASFTGATFTNIVRAGTFSGPGGRAPRFAGSGRVRIPRGSDRVTIVDTAFGRSTNCLVMFQSDPGDVAVKHVVTATGKCDVFLTGRLPRRATLAYFAHSPA